MASTSFRPPPPPRRLKRRPRTDVALLDQEDKFIIIRSSPPRHGGKGIYEVPVAAADDDDITLPFIDFAELDQKEKPFVIKSSLPRHGEGDITRPRTDVAELEEDKAVIIKRPPRRHGKDIDEDNPPETSKEAKRRSIFVQDYQELSRAETYFLQFEASDLFLSNNPRDELSLVCGYACSSLFLENPLLEFKDLWNFCARRYPNALSLMLARLLNLSLSSGAITPIVDLLHLTLIRIHGKDRSSIDDRVILHLRPLLLNVIKDPESTSNILNLSAIVARIYEIKRWPNLLVYLFESLHTDLETKQEMALRVISILPEMREECLGAYKFWWNKRKSLRLRFCQLFGSPNRNIQALTFDASVKLVRLLHRWRFYDEIDDQLPRMIWFLRRFHQEGQTDIVEPRIMKLVELATYYTGRFLNRLDVVLSCMFHIVVTVDDNTFLKCQAIQIIKILDEKDLVHVSRFIAKISKDDKRSIFKNCVRLMLCIEDFPAWYDADTASSECEGTAWSYELGKFLLFRVCLDTLPVRILISFGIEMIPQYLNSEDWQTRHAGMIAFAALATSCGPELMRDQAERLLDISLSDRHPRVRWAAIEAIISLIMDSEQVHVLYLNKFLPRLVTMIRSASIYPRLQLNAAAVVRRLLPNCGAEEVKSFLVFLVPELLNLLKLQGEKFREEAMATLKSLAPVILPTYYREIVDTLKPFVSESLFGAQSIEYLGYVFSESHRHLPFSVLNDAQEVFPTVGRIAANWVGTDSRVKIHILQALSHLCKLPHLVADKFLSRIMPVLTQALGKNTMMLTVNKKDSTFPKQALLACDLLSKLAVRFQEQFRPWASDVIPLLARLFSSSASDAQITSVRALPSILSSCQHARESHADLLNRTVLALVEALEEELDAVVCIEMLKSLNACIVISGAVLGKDLIKQIAELIYEELAEALFDNMETETEEEASAEREQVEEEESANCFVTMIDTLKSDFLTHVDRLLPAVQTLWGRDNKYSDRVKAVGISIFNLILKDYPDRLRRYRRTYALVVMEACHSESPQLQREAARGIGLCAANRGLISYFNAPAAIDRLYHVIQCQWGTKTERAMTYDAAVSAFGKICAFRRDSINGPQVVPIWLNFLPLRNNFDEAKYAHAQLCQMLQGSDQDLLGLNNQYLSQVVRVLKEILSRSDDLATEETTSVIISLLNQFGAM